MTNFLWIALIVTIGVIVILGFAVDHTLKLLRNRRAIRERLAGIYGDPVERWYDGKKLPRSTCCGSLISPLSWTEEGWVATCDDCGAWQYLGEDHDNPPPGFDKSGNGYRLQRRAPGFHRGGFVNQSPLRSGEIPAILTVDDATAAAMMRDRYRRRFPDIASAWPTQDEAHAARARRLELRGTSGVTQDEKGDYHFNATIGEPFVGFTNPVRAIEKYVRNQGVPIDGESFDRLAELRGDSPPSVTRGGFVVRGIDDVQALCEIARIYIATVNGIITAYDADSTNPADVLVSMGVEDDANMQAWRELLDAEVTSDDPSPLPYYPVRKAQLLAQFAASIDPEAGEPLLTPPTPNIGGDDHPEYKGPHYESPFGEPEIVAVPYEMLRDPVPGAAITPGGDDGLPAYETPDSREEDDGDDIPPD